MSKKRIIWIMLIVTLITVWINYTWDLIPGTRAAMDGAAVYAGGIAGGAFGSMYIAIVESPFWLTYVAPWAWLISGCIFSIATMIVFWKVPSIRRKAPVISKKDLTVQREPAEPEPSPPPQIQKTETAPVETQTATTTEKQESV